MAKNWFPVIDQAKCTGCLTCFNFCPHGVLDVDGDKPRVVNPDECVEFCRGCQKICDQRAIRFPGDEEL
jgi:NAD-dependent dihydropyrimidine dehydrogenase PreA subunit